MDASRNTLKRPKKSQQLCWAQNTAGVRKLWGGWLLWPLHNPDGPFRNIWMSPSATLHTILNSSQKIEKEGALGGGGLKNEHVIRDALNINSRFFTLKMQMCRCALGKKWFVTKKKTWRDILYPATPTYYQCCGAKPFFPRRRLQVENFGSDSTYQS